MRSGNEIACRTTLVETLSRIAAFFFLCTLMVGLAAVDCSAQRVPSRGQTMMQKAPISPPPLSATERMVLEIRKAAYKDNLQNLSQLGVGPQWPASNILRLVPSPMPLPATVPLPTVRSREDLLWRSEPTKREGRTTTREKLLWESEPTLREGQTSTRTKLLWGDEPTVREGRVAPRGGAVGGANDSVRQGVVRQRSGLAQPEKVSPNPTPRPSPQAPRSGLYGDADQTTRQGSREPRK